MKKQEYTLNPPLDDILSDSANPHIVNRADGASESGSRTSAEAKAGIATSVLGGVGSLGTGIASIIQAITGNYPDTYIVQEKQTDNTGKYILIIGGILAVVVVAVLLLRK